MPTPDEEFLRSKLRLTQWLFTGWLVVCMGAVIWHAAEHELWVAELNKVKQSSHEFLLICESERDAERAQLQEVKKTIESACAE